MTSYRRDIDLGRYRYGDDTSLLGHSKRKSQNWCKAAASFWKEWLQWPVIGIFVLIVILLLSFRPDVGIYFKQEWSSSDYPALSSEAESIRLLYLEPGQGSQRIESRLKSVTFAEKPSYNALSYTWGDSTKIKSITVNGKRMRVRENLWNALQSTRHQKEPLAIWVDAICIDQHDSNDKRQGVMHMAYIYSRANEVSVWLGHHTPPRWVENSKAVQWRGSWAVDHAKDYWGSAMYWLYLLIHQEYWKRAWIVQEIGMATIIKVYFGRQAIPWFEFVKLVRLYAERVYDPAAQRVLKLEDLRLSKYRGGEAYTMAGHFGDVVVDTDYTRSLFDAYRDLIVARNISTIEKNHIDLVSLSALVRQILIQEASSRTKKLQWFGAQNDPDTYLYNACGDDRAWVCQKDGSGNTTRGYANMDSVTWARDWLLSWIFWPHVEPEAFWRSSSPESKALWLNGSDTENIRVRGAAVDKILFIGPSLKEYLSGSDASDRWASSVTQRFSGGQNVNKAHMQIERLGTLLPRTGSLTLGHIAPLEAGSFSETARESDPRLFVGPNLTVGIIPSNAQVGDVICQFWNTTASAVLRRQHGPKGPWAVVGRAAVITLSTADETGEGEIEWDRLTDRARFSSREYADTVVDIGIDLSQLTLLSFDTLMLTGRQTDELDEDDYPLDRGAGYSNPNLHWPEI